MKIQTVLLISTLAAGSCLAETPKGGVASVLRGMVNRELELGSAAVILADKMASSVSTNGEALGRVVMNDKNISKQEAFTQVRRRNLENVDTVAFSIQNTEEKLGRQVITHERGYTTVRDLQATLRSTATELVQAIGDLAMSITPRAKLETIDFLVQIDGLSRNERVELLKELNTASANQRVIQDLNTFDRDTAYVLQQDRIAKATESEPSISIEKIPDDLGSPSVYRIRLTGTIPEVFKRILSRFKPAEGSTLDPLLASVARPRGEIVGVMRAQDATKYRITRFAEAIDENQIDLSGMKKITDLSVRSKLTIVPNETFLTEPLALSRTALAVSSFRDAVRRVTGTIVPAFARPRVAQ